MYSLEICQKNSHIYLSGPNLVEPVKGCRRKAGRETGETFEEQIEVILQGAPGLIDEWLRSTETIFSKMNNGPDETFLVLQTEARELPYESKILDGKISFLGNGSSDMKLGSLGVRLTLTREIYWRGVIRGASLRNIHGENKTGGLLVDNTFSAAGGKNNFVTIDAQSVQGELPAPARIRLKNVSSGKILSNVVVGLDTFYQMAAGESWYEGEAGSSELTTSIENEGQASGGTYRRIQWESQNEVEAIYWSINSEVSEKIGGRIMRPVLRFAEFPMADDFWARIVVKQGEAVERSAWIKLESNKKMQLIPTVHIPPRGLGPWATDPVRISLMVRRNIAGLHTLNLDFLALIPVDGFRAYSSLGSGGLAENERLVDELDQETIYSENCINQMRKLTHHAIGKGIWLMPNSDQRLIFLFDESGGECGVNDQVELVVHYQPRRNNV